MCFTVMLSGNNPYNYIIPGYNRLYIFEISTPVIIFLLVYSEILNTLISKVFMCYFINLECFTVFYHIYYDDCMYVHMICMVVYHRIDLIQ